MSSERILDCLRQGIPPEDPRIVHVETKSASTVIKRMKQDLNAVVSRKSFRILAIVGPRGLGKSHIMKMVASEFGRIQDADAQTIPVYLEEAGAPLQILKSFFSTIGSSLLCDLVRKSRAKLRSTNDIDLFKYFLDLSNSTNLSVALTRIDCEGMEGIVWKWLTETIGLREINKVSVGLNRLSRNMRTEEAFELLKGIITIISEIYEKPICLLIDEVHQIQELKRKDHMNTKRFIFNLTNTNWNFGIFIGLGCTAKAWRDLADDPYSQSIGLSRRLRKVDLVGLSSIEEAIEIYTKILSLVASKWRTNVENTITPEIIEELYEEAERNPGQFVSKLMDKIDDITAANTEVVKKKREKKIDILQEMERLGEKNILEMDTQNAINAVRTYIQFLIDEKSLEEGLFEAPVVRSSRYRENVCCSLMLVRKNQKIIFQILINFSAHATSIDVRSLENVLSTLQERKADAGIIICIGNVHPRYTTGHQGAEEWLNRHASFQSRLNIIHLDEHKAKIIWGFYQCYGDSFNPNKIAIELDDASIELIPAVDRFILTLPPKEVKIDSSLEKMVLYHNGINNRMFPNIKNRLRNDEIESYLNFMREHIPTAFNTYKEAIKTRLRPSQERRARENLKALGDVAVTFENLLKAIFDRHRDQDIREWMAQPRKRGQLKALLVPKLTRPEERTNWKSKLKIKKFGKYYYSGLFIRLKWVGELLEALHAYGNYDDMSDFEHKLEQLINNKLDENQTFVKNQARTYMTQEVRWLSIALLIRNYTHHETEIPVSLMDSDFTKSFDIIINAMLFTFSLVWRKNIV